MINTDLELASAVSEAIGQSYKEAVEFTTALPSYSLIRYRDLLEEICDIIAKEHGLVAVSISLFEKINELAEHGAITFGLKDRCHRLRKLCNPGAHRRSSSVDSKKRKRLRQSMNI